MPEPAPTDKKNQENNVATGSNNNNSASYNKEQTDNTQHGTTENSLGLKTPVQPSYNNEWHDGVWYNADGTTSYVGVGVASWKSNGTGWWYEDSLGWYPTSSWRKIDGNYLDDDGVYH